MKKSYQYHLFLRNPLTGDCRVQDITVDHEGFMDANTLFRKIECHHELFETGYTLISLNVGFVKDLEK